MIQRTGWYCWKQRKCKGGSFTHCFVRRCSSPEKKKQIQSKIQRSSKSTLQLKHPNPHQLRNTKKNMAKVKHPRPLLATVCCVTINQQQCLVRPIEARLLFSSTIKWARPFTASLTLLLIGPGTWSWQWPCFWRTLTFEGMHMHHNAIGKLRTKTLVVNIG